MSEVRQKHCNAFRTYKLVGFVALCRKLIEERCVDVQDSNLCLLFVNSGHVQLGLPHMLEHT